MINRAKIAAVAEGLRAACDDEDLILDCLEAETELFEVVRILLEQNESDEGNKVALSEQMAARKERRDRCDARIEARRKLIAHLMRDAGLTKLPLPEATISLRDVKAKLAINDPSAVPHEFCEQAWKPKMDEIKASFSPDDDVLPNWLRVERAYETISVRRK